MILPGVLSAARFYPSRYNPIGWWDATNPNGNGVIPANNAALSQCADLSGNGYHWPQSTGSLQPRYVLNAYNGKNAINFSSGQHFAQPYRAALNGPNMSIFIVCAATATTGDFRSILTSRISTPNTKGYILYAESNTGTNRWSLWVGNNSAGSWVENDGALVSLNQLVLLRAFTNVASNSFYVNGTAYNNNPSTAYVANNSNYMYLGAGESGQFGFPGRFCEMVMYDFTLSADQQSKLSNYFRAKWGASIS